MCKIMTKNAKHIFDPVTRSFRIKATLHLEYSLLTRYHSLSWYNTFKEFSRNIQMSTIIPYVTMIYIVNDKGFPKIFRGHL